MEATAAALGDTARWRIVELLAERPRSVGELAELTGLRQPQTTKHLQTLARAELVTVFPLGQRRVYALEAAPLRSLRDRLRDVLDTVAANTDERAVVERYRAAIEAETLAAEQDRWADGRTYTFERVLAAPPATVWRYWVEADLLGAWWAPPSMTVTACALEPVAGGRAVLDYRDADGHVYSSAGQVVLADEPAHLVFDLSVLDATGTVSFTGHYDLTLDRHTDGTHLRVDLTITDTAVAAAPSVAGIATGWGQVLDNLTHTIDRDQRKDHTS